MAERQFIVTQKEDNFLLGHFDGDAYSGVFLSPEYLGRLREVRQAVGLRLDLLGIAEPPDSLKNLLGIIDRLTTAHGEQMRKENAPPTPGDINAYNQAKKELEQAMKALQELQAPPNPPRKT